MSKPLTPEEERDLRLLEPVTEFHLLGGWVPRLLATLDAERTGSSEGLDVERLARALEQAEVGCLGFGGFHGGNDPETAHRRDAEAVAREYATLTRHRGKE